MSLDGLKHCYLISLKNCSSSIKNNYAYKYLFAKAGYFAYSLSLNMLAFAPLTTNIFCGLFRLVQFPPQGDVAGNKPVLLIGCQRC